MMIDELKNECNMHGVDDLAVCLSDFNGHLVILIETMP